ncbi:MBNL [Acanthosepion pharaonis]|uniref:MBNL n=1 Tax=Acanthosepion pharaonis TaxID=158019 RepID=A0A812CSV4_ACAPH|nr:MBNL [Sepia pharaonis]
MEYSGLSRSEILELIKQKKTAILQTKIDMERADNPQAQSIINELKADLHELLAALQTTTHDRSHSPRYATNYELLMRQQSLRDDMTTSVETTALIASQPANSGKPHSLESDSILADVKRQLLDLNEQLRQTHRRDPTTINRNNQTGPSSNMKHTRTQRGTGQSGHPAICRNYLRGRTCFKGNRCPYFHPPTLKLT